MTTALEGRLRDLYEQRKALRIRWDTTQSEIDEVSRQLVEERKKK